MELEVQTLTGAKTRILISRSRSTIGDLKSRLNEHWQIPVAGQAGLRDYAERIEQFWYLPQILAHKGRLLSDRDDAALAELGVQSGDALVVIFSCSRYSPQVALVDGESSG